MIKKLDQLNNSMQSSFNDLVKFLLEEYDSQGNPLSVRGKIGRDIGTALATGVTKAAGLALKGASFAAGVTPFKTGASKLPSLVAKYFSDIGRQQRLYKRYYDSYNLEADKKCVSKAINSYYRRFVDELQQLKSWGILSLKDHTKGEVVKAQDKFWDKVIISNAKFVYENTPSSLTTSTATSAASGTVSPFDIETYTIKRLIEQVNEYNITVGTPRLSIDFFPIKSLVRELILEKRIPDDNINLNTLLTLIQSLFLTVKGMKFDPRRSSRRSRF